MPLFPHRRPLITSRLFQQAPLKWRRGLFRVWAVLSAAWIMSWIIYLAMEFVQRDLGAADFYTWPILLFGPPLALLIFGRGALWARHGFKAS
jgi:hypothetical protein